MPNSSASLCCLGGAPGELSRQLFHLSLDRVVHLVADRFGLVLDCTGQRSLGFGAAVGRGAPDLVPQNLESEKNCASTFAIINEGCKVCEIARNRSMEK